MVYIVNRVIDVLNLLGYRCLEPYHLKRTKDNSLVLLKGNYHGESAQNVHALLLRGRHVSC